MATGVMNFLVKMMRAINDKTASSFYNYTGDVISFFKLGFGVTVFSGMCILILLAIHESVEFDVQDKPTPKKVGQ